MHGKGTLDTSELNKRFFRDLANWYFWGASSSPLSQETPPRMLPVKIRLASFA